MSVAVSSPVQPSKSLHVGLWVVQSLLAVAFLGAGLMKATTPIAELGAKMAWVNSAGEPLVRFIGVAELLGALGLILPSALRIQPKLTPLAGAALAFVMVLAAGTHVSLGEYGAVAPNFVLGGLAAFVAWGRFKQAPIAPRA